MAENKDRKDNVERAEVKLFRDNISKLRIEAEKSFGEMSQNFQKLLSAIGNDTLNNLEYTRIQNELIAFTAVANSLQTHLNESSELHPRHREAKAARDNASNTQSGKSSTGQSPKSITGQSPSSFGSTGSSQSSQNQGPPGGLATNENAGSNKPGKPSGSK
jgi:hypothetical protein